LPSHSEGPIENMGGKNDGEKNHLHQKKNQRRRPKKKAKEASRCREGEMYARGRNVFLQEWRRRKRSRKSSKTEHLWEGKGKHQGQGGIKNKGWKYYPRPPSNLEISGRNKKKERQKKSPLRSNWLHKEETGCEGNCVAAVRIVEGRRRETQGQTGGEANWGGGEGEEQEYHVEVGPT